MSRRLIAAVSTLIVFAAGCGGEAAVPTTTDLREAYAIEYATSARRALTGTRFEAAGDRWLVDSVLTACDRLVPGSDGDAVLAAVIGEAAAALPDPAPGDDQILGEVVIAGVAAVCLDRASAATTSTTAAPDPEDEFLRRVGPLADEAGVFVHPDVLLEAGRGVCQTLDDGDDPAAGVLFAAEVLLGVRVESLADLEGSDGVVVTDGLLLGSVLAAAATHLCPQHADVIAGYIGAVAEGR